MTHFTFCTVDLFKEGYLRDGRNRVIESIDYYLGSPLITLPAQKFTRQSLNFSVKLAINQESAILQNYTYARLKFYYTENKVTTFYAVVFYAFVKKITQVAPETVLMELKVDTLNTFYPSVTFSPLTHIVRQHKDRYVYVPSYVHSPDKMKEVCDRFPEDLNVNLYKTSTADVINNVDNQKWYLSYQTKNDLTSDNLTNPVSVRVIPEKETEIYQPNSNVITADSLADGKHYFVFSNENISGFIREYPSYKLGEDMPNQSNEYVTVFEFYKNGNYVRLYEYRAEKTTSGMSNFLSELSNISITLSGISKVRIIDSANSSSGTLNFEYAVKVTDGYLPVGSSPSLTKFSDYDRTSSKLMKIIEIPYAPFNVTYMNGKMNIPNGYKVVDGYLYAENPDTEFSDVIKSSNALSFNTLVDLPLKRNNNAHDLNKYDPKIHHSDFYTIKYVYDSFTCQLKRENLEVSGLTVGEPTMDVIFKPTNTINSKFLFTLKMTGNNYYIGEEDFPLVILASRNNEKTIFTNDYLNYIRTGYNYDLKKNSNSIIASIVGSSLSIAGGLAMTAVGGGFGKAIGLSTALSGATAIANIINQSVTSSNSMKEKLQSLAYQSTSVSGSDDLDLFNAYSYNVLKREIYEPRRDVKSMIKNLFYLYGYKCNDFGIPDLNTRYWFNYIQADVVLDEIPKPDGMDEEMRNDFTNAFTEGVTIFHYHDELFPHYDLSQTCYNYEMDICNHMPRIKRGEK